MTVGHLTRALISIAAYVRGTVGRTPVASLVTLAVAAAALLYALRARRRPRIAGSTTRPRRERSSQPRPHALAGVHRVTIGCDVLPVNLSETESFSEMKITGSIFESHVASETFQATKLPVVVRRAAVPYLKRIAAMCDLYLVVHILNDESEIAVKEALRSAGIYESGMDERKTLFCETLDGRISIVRQLDPHLHIDPNPEIVSSLRRFVKFVALIAPAASILPGPSGGNVLRYDSLEGLWGHSQ